MRPDPTNARDQCNYKNEYEKGLLAMQINWHMLRKYESINQLLESYILYFSCFDKEFCHPHPITLNDIKFLNVVVGVYKKLCSAVPLSAVTCRIMHKGLKYFNRSPSKDIFKQHYVHYFAIYLPEFLVLFSASHCRVGFTKDIII